MNCPITYLSCGDKRYSPEGLKLLDSRLKSLNDLEYTAEEQRIEAYNRAAKMSVQGVQPKLSAVLSIKDQKFELVLIQQNLLYLLHLYIVRLKKIVG